MVERFIWTLKKRFFSVAYRERLYDSVEALQCRWRASAGVGGAPGRVSDHASAHRSRSGDLPLDTPNTG